MYGVKYIDLVSLSCLAGDSLGIQHGASASHLDLGCAPYWYVLYGVKYTDRLSLALPA